MKRSFSRISNSSRRLSAQLDDAADGTWNVPTTMRSSEWFSGREELAFQNRAALRAMGLNPDDFAGKPVIGIANSWSDLNNCNANLRDLAEAVKRGVLLEGGLPLEFPTISLGEEFMKPSAMLYRNLMAMDVEETLRANPIDGVVLLCNCDKTTPAQLMAAASADLPAIQLNGGPRSSGQWRGETVGSGTDLWRYSDELRTGKISMSDWRELEASYGCGVGGDRVDDDLAVRSARHDAAGNGQHPGDGCSAHASGDGDRSADRADGV